MTTTAPPPPSTRPIRDVAGFLQAVPSLAGFVPHDSLVIVPFASSAATGVLRLDLPRAGAGPGLEEGSVSDVERVAATAIGLACRIDRADSIAVVVYDGSAPWPPDGPLPRERLAGRVIDCADACGLDVRGAYLVAQDGWGHYGDVSAPYPLERIVPEAGAALAHDQHDGTAVPPAPSDEREAVAAALVEARAGYAAALLPHTADDAESAKRWAAFPPLAELPGVLEQAIAWRESRLDPHDAALLALVLSTPMLRDAALTQWSTDLEGGRATLAWQLARNAARAGSPAPTAPASAPPGPLRLAGEGRRPEPWRLRQGLALARRIAAVAPAPARAGAFAAASWLSWALGNSTHASAYAERAVDLEPGHGLAQLLLAVTGAGRLPEWAFRRAPSRSPAHAGVRKTPADPGRGG